MNWGRRFIVKISETRQKDPGSEDAGYSNGHSIGVARRLTGSPPLQRRGFPAAL